MWHAFTDIVLKASAGELSPEAVIEIMIALLAIMIAVLTLIAGLLALFVAFLGIFGFQSILGETKKIAGKLASSVAEKTAASVARDVASKEMIKFLDRAQAYDLSESQVDQSASQNLSAHKAQTSRKKQTTDKGLRGTETKQ